MSTGFASADLGGRVYLLRSRVRSHCAIETGPLMDQVPNRDVSGDLVRCDHLELAGVSKPFDDID